MALTVSPIKLTINPRLSKSIAGQTVTMNLSQDIEDTLADGTGADQADLIYSARITIADSSTPTDLDLSGSLENPFGDATVFADIVTLMVKNNHATAVISVGADGSAPVSTLMGGTGPTLIVRPGGFACLHAPDATGYAVTATTADILQFATDSGTNVTCDVVIIGRSA